MPGEYWFYLTIISIITLIALLCVIMSLVEAEPFIFVVCFLISLAGGAIMYGVLGPYIYKEVVAFTKEGKEIRLKDVDYVMKNDNYVVFKGRKSGNYIITNFSMFGLSMGGREKEKEIVRIYNPPKEMAKDLGNPDLKPILQKLLREDSSLLETAKGLGIVQIIE